MRCVWGVGGISGDGIYEYLGGAERESDDGMISFVSFSSLEVWSQSVEDILVYVFWEKSNKGRLTEFHELNA